jgi:phosphate starvation-inducible protein PhoH and related proteins
MPQEKTLQLELPGADAMRALAGTQNEHLKLIERRLGVRVGQRDTALTLTGSDEALGAAGKLIESLAAIVAAGRPLFLDDVEQALKVLGRGGPELLQAPAILSQKGRAIAPRSLAQKKYVELIRAHDITFGIGPAGTGKTYLAMAMAVSALLERKVRRIILARPAVEAGEKLGFLPGDLAQKVDPYLRPLYDALHDMIDDERAAALIEQGVIEVAPLAFMRGRTLNDCYAILDEAQNTTVEQMKMFLTRLGAHAKAIVTGDVTQIDLPAGKLSGLVHAREILGGVEGVAFAEFSDVDVVRHPVVQNVIRAYERAAKPG